MNGEDDRRGAYRVFISSTYLDNRGRREQVRRAIERAGMVAVGMERFEATDEPTVEDCRKRAAGCDIFVGIIAHRYGWEPEGQEKSITWLEYEAAREASRPRLMFELDPRVPHTNDDLDAGPSRWAKQEKQEKFKAEYAKDQRPAFFEEMDLQAVVLDSLVKWRERRDRPRVPVVPVEDVGSGDDLDAYRRALEAEHGTLHLAGFKTKLRVPIDLAELYVPLTALPDLRGHGEAAFPDGPAAEGLLREGRQPEVSLHEAFRFAASLKPKRRGLVLLGEPGSGKTTHMKRLLLWCLKEGSESLGLEAGMVPVFLPLRRLEDPDRTVHDFIEQQLDACPGVRSGLGKALLSKGRTLLLFDGLDEVVDPERRAEVAGRIDKLAESRPGSVAVVTCRFAGYGPQGSGRSEVRLGDGFLELAVRPLDRLQRNEFVKNWYRVVEGGLAADPEQADKVARDRSAALISTLESPDFRAARVAEMVGNPLLLTNLCLVHRDRGRLPRDRARLYRECVEVLLELWRESKELPVVVSAAQGLRALQPAALWLHEQQGHTRASAAELRPILEPALEAARWDGGGPEEFLRAVKDESGLLTGWGPDQFSFMHLGFQEYLAACELRRLALLSASDRRAIFESLGKRYGDSWWQEVLLLVVGEGNPSLFEPLMRAVVDQPAFARHPELLGLLLEESAEKPTPGPFVELVKRRPGRFRWPWARSSAQEDGELWKRQRVALDVLRRIGADKELRELSSKASQHPSPEIRQWFEHWRSGTRDGIVVSKKGGVEAVWIPGGKLVMGSPKTEVGRWGDERQREVVVEPFLLGRHPVTNEQYARFLKENPGRKEPEYWANRRFNQAQQPVVGVSWDDAVAFAEWAGGRLPTEAEWEYACRAGTTTATYAGDLTKEDKDPVLDGIAWYVGNSENSLHVVGQKAPNQWGLYDMLGNVFEWCSDAAGSHRVIRGGSWSSDAGLVRAANRIALAPGHRHGYLGLRWARGQPVQARPGRSPRVAEPP